MKNKCNFIFLILTLTSCSNNVITSNKSSIISTSSSSVSIETCNNHFDCLSGVKLENINKITYAHLFLSSSWKVNEKYYTDFYNDINVEYQTIDSSVITEEMFESRDTTFFQITFTAQQEEKYINLMYYQNKIYFNYNKFEAYISTNDVFLKEEYLSDGYEGTDWVGIIP